MSEIKGLTYSVYGNTKLIQCICPTCKNKALVIDGETDCCGYAVSEIPTTFKIVSSAHPKRRHPKQKERLRAIERQNGKCIYCGYPFSQTMTRNNKGTKKVISPTINMDHFVPYTYSYCNHSVNFVAACSICNGIKSNKMFDTLEEAKQYVQTIRDRKGYEPL